MCPHGAGYLRLHVVRHHCCHPVQWLYTAGCGWDSIPRERDSICAVRLWIQLKHADPFDLPDSATCRAAAHMMLLYSNQLIHNQQKCGISAVQCFKQQICLTEIGFQLLILFDCLYILLLHKRSAIAHRYDLKLLVLYTDFHLGQYRFHAIFCILCTGIRITGTKGCNDLPYLPDADLHPSCNKGYITLCKLLCIF